MVAVAQCRAVFLLAMCHVCHSKPIIEKTISSLVVKDPEPFEEQVPPKPYVRFQGFTAGVKMGVPEEGGPWTAFTLEASTDDTYRKSNFSVIYHNSSDFAVIPYLIPWCTYTFRYVTETKDGIPSPYSDPVSLKTDPAPPSAPTRPVLVGKTVDSLSISWGSPKRSHGYPVQAYVVSVATGLQGRWKVLFSGASLKYTLTECRNDVKYRIRVAASNALGTGPFSEVVQFGTTNEPPQPAKPHIGNTTVTTISVSWDTVDSPYAAIMQYRLETKKERIGDWNTIYVGLDTHFKAERMDRFTRYYFRVCAVNMFGTSQYSDWMHATTLDTVPYIDESRTNVTSSRSFKVAWGMPSASTGPNTMIYKLYIKCHGARTNMWPNSLLDGKYDILTTFCDPYRKWTVVYKGKEQEKLVELGAPGLIFNAYVSTQYFKTKGASSDESRQLNLPAEPPPIPSLLSPVLVKLVTTWDLIEIGWSPVYAMGCEEDTVNYVVERQQLDAAGEAVQIAWHEVSSGYHFKYATDKCTGGLIYQWRMRIENCMGSAPDPVWSEVLEASPTLPTGPETHMMHMLHLPPQLDNLVDRDMKDQSNVEGAY